MSQDFADFMAWVEKRSKRDEDTGCLIWGQSLAHGTDPQGRYLGKIVLVRRVILQHTKVRVLQTRLHAVATCDVEGCVEPAHLAAKLNGHKQKGKTLSLAHRAKISAAVRASTKAKLTPEAVEDIRTKAEKREVYAQRYGILATYVNDIQGYATWREYVGNPFAGLGA